MIIFRGHGFRFEPIARRRAAMLLEMVLSMMVLFLGMAVVGLQLNSAVQSGYRNERLTQGLMLAEAKLAQLDTGVIAIERELEGEVGPSFPGYFWRFYFEPHEDMEDLYRVQLDILYGPPSENGEEGDISEASVVTTLRTLRPVPPTLNLQRDFGFTEEKMAEISEALPADMIDPTNISPAMFRELDLETLQELMPLLIELFGQGFGFSQEQLQQAIDGGLLDPSQLPSGSPGSELESLKDSLPKDEEGER